MWFIRVWVPLAVGITGVCAILYGVTMQSQRQALNDPQIQIAQDVATLLLLGASPSEFSTREPVDISRSLSPWFAIYGENREPLVATGFLSGAMPVPPPEVFHAMADASSAATASRYPEIRLSWQPEKEVRQAIVVVKAGDRYVIAGRNMREAEQRIWQAQSVIVLGWLITLAAALVAVWLGAWMREYVNFVSE